MGTKRKGAILIFIAFILTVSIAGVMAATAISFNGQTPANGSTQSSAMPVISTNVVATPGDVNPADVKMTVDGVAVDPTFTSTTGGAKVSYQPTSPLNDGLHAVALTVYDELIGREQVCNWSFSVDATPKVTNVYPGEGATVLSANTKISAVVKDNYDNLNTGSCLLKIDGVPVQSVFTLKGTWVADSCGGPDVYNVTSYKEGTVEYQATGLTHGQHTAELTLADVKGNVLKKSWTFMVQTRATTSGFSNQSPGNGLSTGAACPAIGVTVSVTEGTVTVKDVQMLLDGNPVAPVLAPGNLQGVYNLSYTPTTVLADGIHTVQVSVYNPSLLPADTSWSFSVNKTPKVTSVSPADGVTIGSTSPNILMLVKDDFDNLNEKTVSMKIDSLAVPAKFTYKGTYSQDSCTGITYYTISSYKEGTVAYQPTGLADGRHTVEVSIADVNGNVLTKQWSFTVGSKPTFSNYTPVTGTEAKTVTGISVKVSDDTGINPQSIELLVNNTKVTHTYDAATGLISFNNTYGQGSYKVWVSAADTSGNIATATWSFVVSTQPPTITATPIGDRWPYTEFKEGLVITDGTFKFRATITDVVDITPDTTLKIDGQVVPADILYEGAYDSCGSGTYYIKSKKTVYVNYSYVIPDGPHSVEISYSNIYGAADSKKWNINVVTKPTITDWQPTNYISKFRPTISAVVKDVNTGIDVKTISMAVDGQSVNYTYDQTTGRITFTPPDNLANESYHTVSINVKDLGGLESSITWKFAINTYPDMADSNISNCTSCHQLYGTAGYYRGDFERVHARKLSFGGTHSSNDCGQCHGYITYPQECGQCHGDPDSDYSGPMGHGTQTEVKYSVANTVQYQPIRVTQNREMWDCIICHQPGAGTLGTVGYYVNPTRLLNNHDIPELHKAPVSDCTKCHAQSLTREHARDGRKDKAGNPITCNTCHMSSDPAIKNAITNHQKNCETCHVQANHEAVHSSGLDSNCRKCHNPGLTVEHISNSTTAGKNLDCKTCHTNQSRQVVRSIGTGNLNCAGCHSKGHNMIFIDKVPADIWLDPQFKWTTSMEAALFMGDTGIPSGYENGQVVLTNRMKEVSVDQVWAYYKDNMSAAGWNLQSEAPGAGTTRFEATYYKDGRFVTILCYTTQERNGAGTANGTRVEVWYK